MLGDDFSDEEAKACLAECGLSDPAVALQAIRSLGQRTTLSQAPSAGRNVLANLLGVWMRDIARSARPELVLIRFEQLAARSEAATPLFRSLLESEGFRDILRSVLDAGEMLAQRLIRYPELLDALLRDPVPLDSGDGAYALDLQDECARAAAEAFAEDSIARGEDANRLTGPGRERLMNCVRRFKAIEEFKLLVAWLGGGALETLEERLSILADCIVDATARWHADADPAWAIVALGKLGGRELTVHSDLDLVVVYEGDPADSATFLRFQSFVEAMHAFLEQPTSEGIAYRIDTRLRPEGKKGALAIPLAAFREYLHTRAETWERLAWTRSRVLAGAASIVGEIRDVVARFVYGPWDPGAPRAVHDVRLRMERELAHETPRRVDFKVGRGGLADIDFALELVQIREGARKAGFRVAGTRALLAALPPSEYLTADEADWLGAASRFLRRLEAFARMDADSSVTGITTESTALDPLGIRMGFEAAAPGTPGVRLLGEYRATTEAVRSVFRRILERLERA